MRKRTLFSALLVTCTLTACQTESVITPSAPASAVRSTVATAAIPTQGGLTGFHFLPPIGPPPPTVVPDASALDLLAVEICEWNGTACVGSLLRRYTSVPNARVRLQVDTDGTYGVDWGVFAGQVNPDRDYRIRVLATGGELGFADVNVRASIADPERPGIVNVLLGETLPIRFRIAQGTGGRVGPGGGVVQLSNGVRLNIPAGALTQERYITATRTTALPPSAQPLIPGTGWDFGPDGLVFARPVTMTIPYNPADVPGGVPEAELRIHKLVGSSYQQQDAGQVDLINKTVSAEVTGFSVYVIIRRDPLNPEDILGSVVRRVEVLNPTTNTFGNAVTLNTSAADAPMTFRLTISDNISGVAFVDVRWTSSSGRQVRFPCYTNSPPNTGSVNLGEWTCSTPMPRYAEAGLWRPNLIWITDRVGNRAIYSPGTGGLCDRDPRQANCIADVPQVTVVSTPTDETPPVLSSLLVSPNITPRTYGPTVSVDVRSAFAEVILGFAVTDNLSGVGDFVLFDGFDVELYGPSGQVVLGVFFGCTRTTGTAVSGFWECRVRVPAQAESGIWRIARLAVPDRAGNAGWARNDDFRLVLASGQLCRASGPCIASPTLEVVGAGDRTGPDLQTLSIVSNGPDVTTTLGLRDLPSGVQSARVFYSSVTTSQQQSCFATRITGTNNLGTFACTITFSALAARGQWVISLDLLDIAGNRRFYTRRASDGFLCYQDPGMTSALCQNFGTTDLILR